MSNSRDNVIESKLTEVENKINELNKAIVNLANFETNLFINFDNNNINLRASNSPEMIRKAFDIIDKIADKEVAFSKVIEDTDIDKDNVVVGTYTYKQWVSDLRALTYKKKLAEQRDSLRANIEKLKSFYSDERKDSDAFASVLNSIDLS